MPPTLSEAVRAILLALAALSAAPRAHAADPRDSAVAQAGWSAEFEDLCSSTQDATALSDEELRGLIARCDKLKPAIDRIPGPEGKVYSRRLQRCRDLYQFVLDSRASKGQQ